MSGKELNDKKRKAGPSPKSQVSEISTKLIKKAQKIRKTRQAKQKLVLSDESDIEDRGRTPSGTELTGKVQGIRSFFLPINKRDLDANQDSQRSVKGSSDRESMSESCMSEQNQTVKSHIIDMVGDQNNNNEDQGHITDSPEKSIGSEKAFLMSLAGQIKEISEESFEKTFLKGATNEDQRGEEALIGSNQEEVMQSPNASIRMVSNREENEEENPKVMGVSSVLEMLKSLKKDISKEIKSEIQCENSKLRTTLKQDMEAFQERCIEQATKEMSKGLSKVIGADPKIRKMEQEVAFWKVKAETLTEVCDRMNTEIQDLTTRLDSVELNCSKKKLIMTGVQLPSTKLKDKQQNIIALEKFLEGALQIPVKIDDYFMVGDGELRPIVLIFPCLEMKRAVFQNKGYLKDIKVEGRKVYINEYLPPIALEKKKRDQDIVSKMKQNGQDEQLTYIHGQIAIQGKIYKKMVTPPGPKELINITAEEIEKILKISMCKGVDIVKLNSHFIGYSVEATTHHEINEAYKKIKMIRPNARHVVCAYIINYEDEANAQDYHDDGEPGAGRVVLDLLQQKGITNKAVFIARKFGGVKMGLDRFQCYVQAARACLGLEEWEDDTDRNNKYRSHNPGNRGRGAYTSASRGRGGKMYPMRGRGGTRWGRGRDASSPGFSIRFQSNREKEIQENKWFQGNSGPIVHEHPLNSFQQKVSPMSMQNIPALMQNIQKMQQQLQSQMERYSSAPKTPTRYEQLMQQNVAFPPLPKQHLNHQQRGGRGGSPFSASPASSRRSSVYSQEMEIQEVEQEEEDIRFKFSNLTPQVTGENASETWSKDNEGEW